MRNLLGIGHDVVAHASIGIVSAMASVAALAAQDSFIVGPRALGMGGTGVACADDQAVQYYNPALLGFMALRSPTGERLASDNNDLGRKEWGIGIADGGLGLRVHGELLEIANDLADLRRGHLSDDGIQSADDVRSLVTVARSLATVDDPANAVTVDGSMGMSVRIGHFMVGMRLYGETTSLVRNVDLANVAFQVGGVALANSINSSGSPMDGSVTAFSPAQRDSLYSAMGGSGPFNSSSSAGQAVQRLDYEVRSQGLSQEVIDQAFIVLQNAATATGASTVKDNDTVVRLGGFALAEFPISYGWSVGENLSIGASLKFLVGRVYGSEISIFEDDAALRIDHAVANYQQTANVGIDLGVAWRMRMLQVGICGRNLNAPTFDGFIDPFGVHIDDVRMDPQVAVGVAFIPWDWLTLSADGDLIAADTTFDGYQTQRIGCGLEIAPWRVVAIRVGTYRNIAESDIGPVVTAGLGLNLWAIRIDLAAASSFDLTTVSDYELPDELRAGLGMTSDF